MSKIESTFFKLINPRREGREILSPPAMLILTIIYLIAVLSVPVSQPQKLIWLAAYPIVFSEIINVGYGKILGRSLWVLPLVVLIGIFNPFYDRTIAFQIGSIDISRGWVSFASIILRGLLSFQAVLILIATTGFLEIFSAMRKLKIPEVLCSQMLLTYRYISVLLEEVIVMKRARSARGYGRSSYPLKMWGRFIGQLLIRATQRATHIHRAMLARGYKGILPTGNYSGWNKTSIIGLCLATLIILFLRFFDFSKLFASL